MATNPPSPHGDQLVMMQRYQHPPSTPPTYQHSSSSRAPSPAPGLSSYQHTSSIASSRDTSFGRWNNAANPLFLESQQQQQLQQQQQALEYGASLELQNPKAGLLHGGYYGEYSHTQTL